MNASRPGTTSRWTERAAVALRLCLALCLLPVVAGAERVARHRVPSPANGASFPVRVATPSEGAPTGTLYLLHGAGCDTDTWDGIADLAALADTWRRVVVVPSPGPHTWYIDSTNGPGVRAATFIVEELVPWVDARYGTARGDRWITGFSMGGYGALRIGLTHPDVFHAVGALSPCIEPSRWAGHWRLDEVMGTTARADGRFDLLAPARVAALGARTDLVLSIACGRLDFFFAENAEAHRRLEAAGVPHGWSAPLGAHTLNFWERALPAQLRELAARRAAVTAREQEPHVGAPAGQGGPRDEE